MNSRRLKRFDFFDSFSIRDVSGGRHFLHSVSYSQSGTNITITGFTIGDVSAGVFGVRYGIGQYSFSVNVPGGVSSQSITIGASDGISSGDTVLIEAYVNLNPLDPSDSRSYGIPALVVVVP